MSASVHIEGSFFVWHSLAHVNRELAVWLHRQGLDVSIAPNENPPEAIEFPHQAELSTLVRSPGPESICLRHAFPPNQEPLNGPLILMQPWEFFAAPRSWVQFVNVSCTELWVNSHFTRQSFIRTGTPPHKVTVLPLGVDTEVFRPDGESWQEFGHDNEFRFIYCGGTITRKGADILFEAYLREFEKDENVRLVVKDTGTRHVYRHNNLGLQFKEAARDPSCAPISYYSDDLSPLQLASLIRSCHCAVLPYRGEGFCLPALEAMACGLPVIATAGGSTDDLIIHNTGWKILARPAIFEQLPGLESVIDQAWLEPDQEDLRALMRSAFENRSLAKKYGANAAKLATEHWSWEQVARQYAERISTLAQGKTSSRIKRAQISLCMIVRDEERVLEACLESARPHFDEIIIVDTGSTDKTKEIAARFTDKVFDYPWTDSFSEARNESLKHATGNWIFWMDADDTLPEECGEAIRWAAENALPFVNAFVIPVQFVEAGPGSGTRVDHVKLFRNLPGVRFEGRIHEQIIPSLREHGGVHSRLNAIVLHSGYDTSETGQAKKRKRDEKLLALDLEERPNHPFVLFNLGMTAHYAGDHDEALKWLERSLAVSKDESHVRKLYALMAASLRVLGRNQECISILEKGIELVGNDPDLRFLQGQILLEVGRAADAKQAYLAMDLDISNFYSSIDIGILGFKRNHNLGNACDALKQYSEAKDYWRKALDEAPQFLVSAFQLFNASLENRDFTTAVEMLEKVRSVEGPSENWANMVFRYGLESGGPARAVEILDLASRDFSEAVPPKLVLQRKLLEYELEDRALPLMHELNSRGIAEASYTLGVFSARKGQFAEALSYMERAAELDPNHAETIEQVQALRTLIAQA